MSTSKILFPAGFTCIAVYADVPVDDPEDPAPDLATGIATWDSDPVLFAQQLRDLAAFIEHHAKTSPSMRLEVECSPPTI